MSKVEELIKKYEKQSLYAFGGTNIEAVVKDLREIRTEQEEQNKRIVENTQKMVEESKRLIRDPENGVFDIVEWSRNFIGVVDEMFTESEIKEKDERYLPFAVKVEEEQD